MYNSMNSAMSRRSSFGERYSILSSDEPLVFCAELCDPFGDSPGGFETELVRDLLLGITVNSYLQNRSVLLSQRRVERIDCSLRQDIFLELGSGLRDLKQCFIIEGSSGFREFFQERCFAVRL